MTYRLVGLPPHFLDFEEKEEGLCTYLNLILNQGAVELQNIACTVRYAVKLIRASNSNQRIDHFLSHAIR